MTTPTMNLCTCGREKDTQDARCMTCQDQIADTDEGENEADAVDNCF